MDNFTTQEIISIIEVVILAFGGIGIFYQIRHMRLEHKQINMDAKKVRWESLNWALDFIHPDDLEKMFRDEDEAIRVLARWNLIARAADSTEGVVDKNLLFQMLGDIFSTAYQKYLHEKKSTFSESKFIIELLEANDNLFLRNFLEEAHNRTLLN